MLSFLMSTSSCNSSCLDHYVHHAMLIFFCIIAPFLTLSSMVLFTLAYHMMFTFLLLHHWCPFMCKPQHLHFLFSLSPSNLNDVTPRHENKTMTPYICFRFIRMPKFEMFGRPTSQPWKSFEHFTRMEG